MSVDFLYNAGRRGVLGLGRLNLGDLLCSPSSYFDFQSEVRTLIIGGGIQSGFLTGKTRPSEDYDHVCIWGGGFSSRPENRLSGQLKGIESWTTRDLDCVESDVNWIPCVSCLHPMLSDIKVKNIKGKGMLYVNSDPIIYSLSSLLESRRIAKTHGLRFCTNRAPVQVFFKNWRDCQYVVTNSYHGAYWSLLAGKQVAVFGYNYKFESLGSMFGLDIPVINFSKQNRSSLLTATRVAVSMQDFRSLNEPRKTLNFYRSLQIQYAKMLVDSRILIDFKLKRAYEFPLDKGSRLSELKNIVEEYIALGLGRLRIRL